MATKLWGSKRGIDQFIKDAASLPPLSEPSASECQLPKPQERRGLLCSGSGCRLPIGWPGGHCENRMLNPMGHWPDPATRLFFVVVDTFIVFSHITLFSQETQQTATRI